MHDVRLLFRGTGAHFKACVMFISRWIVICFINTRFLFFVSRKGKKIKEIDTMVITDRLEKLGFVGTEQHPFMSKDGENKPRESVEVEFMLRNMPSILRSSGEVEKFDPHRIMDSLLKETSITEEKAREVTWEVMIKMLTSDQKVLTAPFIREQVCTILFQKNPKWRFEYTRLGMAFHDFEKICNGYFNKYRSVSQIEGSIDKIILTLDNATLGEIVSRMAKDYIGVRNRIHDDNGSSP